MLSFSITFFAIWFIQNNITKNIQYLKICCYLIAARSGSGIRISNADPDPDPGWPSLCGSMWIHPDPKHWPGVLSTVLRIYNGLVLAFEANPVSDTDSKNKERLHYQVTYWLFLEKFSLRLTVSSKSPSAKCSSRKYRYPLKTDFYLCYSFGDQYRFGYRFKKKKKIS